MSKNNYCARAFMFLHISLPSPAKQQREMAKFKVFWRTRPHDDNIDKINYLITENELRENLKLRPCRIDRVISVFIIVKNNYGKAVESTQLSCVQEFRSTLKSQRQAPKQNEKYFKLFPTRQLNYNLKLRRHCLKHFSLRHHSL